VAVTDHGVLYGAMEFVFWTRSGIRIAPSRRLYWVWQWRWTKPMVS